MHTLQQFCFWQRKTLTNHHVFCICSELLCVKSQKWKFWLSWSTNSLNILDISCLILKGRNLCDLRSEPCTKWRQQAALLSATMHQQTAANDACVWPLYWNHGFTHLGDFIYLFYFFSVLLWSGKTGSGIGIQSFQHYGH